MTIVRVMSLLASAAVLAGCALLPLDDEIKTACAATPDPPGCTRAKYAEAFADERARVARQGLMR